MPAHARMFAWAAVCGLPVLSCAPGYAGAQREVPMPAAVQPTETDAVIAGNALPRTLTCTDRVRVFVQGNRNEVQLYGSCGPVRVVGDGNYVWLDREGSVAVQGSNNVVFIRTSTTRVSSQGSGNRFELRR